MADEGDALALPTGIKALHSGLILAQRGIVEAPRATARFKIFQRFLGGRSEMRHFCRGSRRVAA
jgi:hypothetical protein